MSKTSKFFGVIAISNELHRKFQARVYVYVLLLEANENTGGSYLFTNYNSFVCIYSGFLNCKLIHFIICTHYI